MQCLLLYRRRRVRIFLDIKYTEIRDPCYELKEGLTEQPLMYRYEWVITASSIIKQPACFTFYLLMVSTLIKQFDSTVKQIQIVGMYLS